MATISTSCTECGYLREQLLGEETSYQCVHPDTDIEILEELDQPKRCPKLEDVLDALRFRVKYREQNIYVVISYKFGIPCEVFAEYPMNSDNKLMFLMSGWDTTTRLISLSLKAYPLMKVVHQLQRSSRQTTDLPGILSELLLRPYNRTFIK